MKTNLDTVISDKHLQSAYNETVITVNSQWPTVTVYGNMRNLHTGRKGCVYRNINKGPSKYKVKCKSAPGNTLQG